MILVSAKRIQQLRNFEADLCLEASQGNAGGIRVAGLRYQRNQQR